jgi:hypothetical protein
VGWGYFWGVSLASLRVGLLRVAVRFGNPFRLFGSDKICLVATIYFSHPSRLSCRHATQTHKKYFYKNLVNSLKIYLYLPLEQLKSLKTWKNSSNYQIFKTGGGVIAKLLILSAMFFNFINEVCAQDWTPPNTNDVVITQDANVGIGVTNPTAKLQIAGTVKLDSFANSNGTKYLLYVDENGEIKTGAEYKPNPGICSNTFTYWRTNGNQLTGTGLLDNPPCEFIGSINEFPLNFRTNNEERLRIETDGNVHVFQKIGIATTNYAAQLNFSLNDGTQKFMEGLHNNQKTFSVFGDGRTVINSSQSSDPILEINQSTNPIFYAYSDRVGIGTVFPDNFFGQGSAMVRIQGKNSSTNRNAIIHFQNENATNTGSLEIGQDDQNAVINSFGTNLVINYHENKNVDIFGKTTTNKGLVAKNDDGSNPALEVDGTSTNPFKKGIFITSNNINAEPFTIENSGNKSFQIFGDGRTLINTNNVQSVPFSIQYNDNGVLLPKFKIYGNGRTEIFATNDDKMLHIRRDNLIQGNNKDVFSIYGDGRLFARQIKVSSSSPWADYVFEKNYSLLPLNELKQYIEKYKHLPNIPSASTIEKEGINVGEMNKLLLEKIEELTLYILQLEERIQQLEK